MRVHIVDDDRDGGGTPELAIEDVEVTEGLPATFAVTLSATSEVPVTFSYETRNGTATAGSDYTSKSGPLTIPAGERIGLVEVQTIHDNVREETESFTVRLSGVSGATLTDGTATGTILDDDVDPPPLAIADAEVTEGGMATFVVTLGPGATGQVTVDYQTQDGTATEDSDYMGETGTLIFAPGELTQRVEVQTIDDTDQEQAETFTVLLSGESGATLTDDIATGTILDDDDVRPPLTIADAAATEGEMATFTVTLGPGATGQVTVYYQTQDGTATEGSDYMGETGTLIFAPGELTQRVEVQTNQDDLQEGTETFTVRLSDVTGARLARASGIGSIADDDGGGGGGGGGGYRRWRWRWRWRRWRRRWWWERAHYRHRGRGGHGGWNRRLRGDAELRWDASRNGVLHHGRRDGNGGLRLHGQDRDADLRSWGADTARRGPDGR